MLVGSVPMHRHAWIIAAVFNLKYQLLSAVQLYLADSEIGSLSKAALFFFFYGLGIYCEEQNLISIGLPFFFFYCIVP